MKINQLILININETADQRNDLTYIIYTNNEVTRYSYICKYVDNGFPSSYKRAFEFKAIYDRKTSEEN